MTTRQGKGEGAIDWDKLAEKWEAKWEALDGTALAQVAPNVSGIRGPGGGAVAAGPRGPEPGGPAPDRAAQTRAMQQALAQVQAAHSNWTRADLMRELAACLPAEARRMEPAVAVGLLHDLTDRALARRGGASDLPGRPRWPPPPDYLRRELDGRSVYSRPGTSRYATQVQLNREERLTARAGQKRDRA